MKGPNKQLHSKKKLCIIQKLDNPGERIPQNLHIPIHFIVAQLLCSEFFIRQTKF